MQVTFTYPFQMCAGDITLDGYRSAHMPQAYIYEGKRYSDGEVGTFKRNKDDLFLTFNFINENLFTCN